MDREIYNRIKNAGVVGAGGAGFPTHVKLDCEAEYVIVNGAECEPLLRVDQQLMDVYAEELIEGLRAEMRCVGAKQGVILIKGHYESAVKRLSALVKNIKDIRLHVLERSFYPAGDELQVIHEVTGRVVPTGGLPKDVGCVVSNAASVINVARAMQGKPVISREVTVGGAVFSPCTLTVPIGMSMEELLAYAGGPTEECVYIIGGPCMGTVTRTLQNSYVTKTTGGLLAIPVNHPLLQRKDPDINVKLMQSVCCQCSMCTQMCPRNALGLNVQPHKAMRAIANGNGELLGEINGIFSCCDCGVCTYVACNFGLKPNQVMKRVKGMLQKNGVRAVKEQKYPADRYAGSKQLPTSRLITRLGIDKYDVDAPLIRIPLEPDMVRIPLKMHTGAPAAAVVQKGDAVKAGDLIADMAENALGAKIHASIDGKVTDVTDLYIEITAAKGEKNN